MKKMRGKVSCAKDTPNCVDKTNHISLRSLSIVQQSETYYIVLSRNKEVFHKN